MSADLIVDLVATITATYILPQVSCKESLAIANQCARPKRLMPFPLRVNPMNVLTELKRRNVYRAAVAYGVVAWLLTQLTTQVFPFFEIPNSAVRFVVIALVVGFPIAMLLAWLYELTPEGIVRTEDLDPVRRDRFNASPDGSLTSLLSVCCCSLLQC